MENFVSVLFILCNIALQCTSTATTIKPQLPSVVDNSGSEKPFSDAKGCEDKCLKSFAPHTYPNGEDSNACMRGCRFYSISDLLISFKNKESTEKNVDKSIKTTCYDYCVEAYNKTSKDNAACQTGCDTQEQLLKQANSDDVENPDSGFHLLRPVMQIREVMSKVIGMLRIVKTSIITYFVREDNKLVAVEGPVEVLVEVLPQQSEENSIEQIDDENKQPQQQDRDGLVARGSASIECLSEKVGVPPYLLIISFVSFVIFFIYIMFVICSSNNKKKKMKCVSLPACALPVKLVRPEDLTKLSLIDEEEAMVPGLNTKLKLPHNSNV